MEASALSVHHNQTLVRTQSPAQRDDAAAHECKFRRPRSLVVCFRDDDLVVYNYLKDISLEIDAAAFELLTRFTTWKTVDEVIAELPHWDPDAVRQSTTVLLEHHLLLAEADEYDRGLDGHWQRWEDDARFFHFWTRGTFVGSIDSSLFQTEDGHWRQAASSLPWADELTPANSPPPFKRYPEAPRLYLPRAFLPLTRPYQEVLVSRRTRRHFSTEPVGLRELSTLLHYTFGPMYFCDHGDFGILQMRTSACGGARHEAECYVGVLNVQGVPRGLYHYCAIEHSLELLRSEFTPEMAVNACAGQPWVADVGCLFYISTVFERSSWKYRFSRVYRALWLNLGHLGQTFALTATTLGLAPFVTAAIADEQIERWLGLDPFKESMMLMTACGSLLSEDRDALYVPVMGPTRIPLVCDHALPEGNGAGESR
jgi:SagB-type dehydrogenase family enzyme